MPCGCFGGGKKGKSKKPLPADDTTTVPLCQSSPPAIEVKAPPLEKEPFVSSKRRDVVATENGDECALLGYRSTGSRPPSSCVDSTTSSPDTTASYTYVATCRAQLAEKRREFFRELIPEDYRASPYTLSSTLPTAARARQFGKVRIGRPVSQPSHHDDGPVEAPPLPPGPHLLHPTPSSPKGPTKIDYDGSGFASAEFLHELRNASEEISRRWAMSDEEKSASPSTLKMSARGMTHVESTTDTEVIQGEQIIQTQQSSSHVSFDTSPSVVISTTHEQSLTKSLPTNAAVVPQTMITPPSPPTMGDELLLLMDDRCVEEQRENDSDSEDEVMVNLRKDHDDFDIETFGDFPGNESDLLVEDVTSSYITHEEERKLVTNPNILSEEAEGFVYASPDGEEEVIVNAHSFVEEEFETAAHPKYLPGGESETMTNAYPILEEETDLVMNTYPIAEEETETLMNTTPIPSGGGRVDINTVNEEELVRPFQLDDSPPAFKSEAITSVDRTNMAFSIRLEDPGVNVEFKEGEICQPEQYGAADSKQELDSPGQDLDSPSDLESMSTSASITTSTLDKSKKMDTSESLHLHDDGLGSEIDEGSDIIEEMQSQAPKVSSDDSKAS